MLSIPGRLFVTTPRAAVIVCVLFLAATISSTAFAQVNRNAGVRRYNRIARGKNVDEWQKRLLDDDTKTRLDAVASLGKDGSKKAVPGLIDALADVDYRVRVKAIDYLGLVGDPRATPVLMQMLYLNDISKPTKLRALTALGRMGDASVSAELLNYANTVEDDDLSCRAIFALGDIADPRTTEGLIQLAQNTHHPHVVRLCDDAVDKIQESVDNAPGQQPTLLELERRFAPPTEDDDGRGGGGGHSH